MTDWRPRASLETLQARARLYALCRSFFAERGVMEVATPVLSSATALDIHIHSWSAQSRMLGRHWLQTSPEFAMKRLLAGGSGPIYQICPVFREDEQGRLHNPEFTMLEWYRPGFDHHQLMDELAALLVAVVPDGSADLQVQRLSYREVVFESLGIDPHQATAESLRLCVQKLGIPEPENISELEMADRDFWLDLLVGLHIGPSLGKNRPLLVFDYPASQASLARIRQDTPPVAERFELYWQGVEIANGYHELTDAIEQRRRFVTDQQRRRERGLNVPPLDENLLAALASGMPECAGVAVGLDRLLMCLLKLDSVSETLAFPFDRA